MAETVTLKSTCTVCEAKWAMTDSQDRVMAAYKVWDAEHKHTDTKQES